MSRFCPSKDVTNIKKGEEEDEQEEEEVGKNYETRVDLLAN